MSISNILQRRIEQFKTVDLYAVTCEALSAGRTNRQLLDVYMRAGIRAVQLREKEWTREHLLREAMHFRAVTRAHNALLIINDHIDIAVAVDADGVHLGQQDLALESARNIAPDLLIGISTHSEEQALKAQSGGAGYVNIGPVYPTNTKTNHTGVVGVELVRRLAPRLRIPFSVMGGIQCGHLAELREAGARTFAVVTMLSQSLDPTVTILQARNALSGQQKI